MQLYVDIYALNKYKNKNKNKTLLDYGQIPPNGPIQSYLNKVIMLVFQNHGILSLI